MEWLIFVAVGLLVGWLAGLIMKGGGFGLVGDLLVGIGGMFLGRWLAGLIGLSAHKLVAEIGIGVAGACVLIGIIHWIKKK